MVTQAKEEVQKSMGVNDVYSKIKEVSKIAAASYVMPTICLKRTFESCSHRLPYS